ncbi:ABC transporter ATP-binding protein [Actinomadura vinacea]|uniref:ABC transporter ATP-binding protein n=1 Tax=Actinomadura vinacea TaxID=115336 RepID=A0ABN3JSB7_9ACTN
MSGELLQVSGLSLSYGSLRAVDDVSFTVREGEVVSVIGPNGSGKTTTINLISGLLAPHAGRIVFAGREIQGHKAHRVAKAGIARTFQNGRVFGNLTVAANVEVALHATRRASRPLSTWSDTPVARWAPLFLEAVASLVGGPRRRREQEEVRRLVAEQLDRFPDRLPERAEHSAHTLSYANRRRTEIARALVPNPRLLLLDEPTAGMNPAETDEIMRKLLELKEAGQTMLLVEHKMDLVNAVSDRVVVLDGGKLLVDGAPEVVQADPRVIEAYLGRRRAPVTDD